MARGLQFGSFLLLAACVLLIVASISAPVVNHIRFLTVQAQNENVVFGTFGYCRNLGAAGSDGCSRRQVGYHIVQAAGQVSQYKYANEALDNLTGALVIHPIAAGLAFLAFLVAIASDHLGFIFASFITLLAFLASLVVMVIDFVLFGIIRHEVNANGLGTASWGNAIWMVLAATIALFIGIFVVFFECCCGSTRRSRRQDKYMDAPPMQQVGYAPQRSHWWSRRRY